jgi:succinate-semialdehyde dehydrogenase/glutarate-semialdehyde dehydrogenase/aspartate-semialdehyde dehydrogenase
LREEKFLVGDAFVGGEWLHGAARQTVSDPATGAPIADAATCDRLTIGRAIDVAHDVWTAWRALLPVERGALLLKWAALIEANADSLARLLTCEQGKPLRESAGEIAYATGFLKWFAAEGERAYGDTVPSHKRDSRIFVRQQPIGVVAAITPWNFPCAMITRKAGAALAAGCPVIVKPANETPFSALALARLAQDAGIPDGVFQVVTGDPAALTGAMMDSPKVRAMSFTGSTPVGRRLLGQAAATVKKVSLELGGHAPFVVFGDADLDKAVAGAMAAKFATSGQDCLAANRIYVQRPIYAAFAERFAKTVSELRVGHGLDPATDIGPMTRASVAANCRAQIADATASGARVIFEGEGGRSTNFVAPTVLADVDERMLVAREETFGPVAALLPFDDEGEVVARANAGEYGLAAYVYTDDLRRAHRVSDALEFGMVGVNTPSFTGPPIPFGGWKQSGLGREGSRHGLSEFTELKYVCFGDLAG